MTKFRFMHNTYEVPDGVDVKVFVVQDHDPPIHDFDFYKNGEVIAMLGGTDSDGNRLPTWADVGIVHTEWPEEKEES